MPTLNRGSGKEGPQGNVRVKQWKWGKSHASHWEEPPSRERESTGELGISRSNKVMSPWTRGDDSRQVSGEAAVYLVG